MTNETYEKAKKLRSKIYEYQTLLNQLDETRAKQKNICVAGDWIKESHPDLYSMLDGIAFNYFTGKLNALQKEFEEL